MQKRCLMLMIYLSWGVYAGGLAYLGWRAQWGFALGWLVTAPLAQWLYIVKFPALSPFMGYGRIIDEPSLLTGRAPAIVTLYTALGCPFCPLMEQRLHDLQKSLHFDLHKIDVTLRPDLLAGKGIRSVPVVEVSGRLLIGLVTSKDLAGAITEAGEPAGVAR
jgi:thiol-disulfide isomerase/thioredoxin